MKGGKSLSFVTRATGDPFVQPTFFSARIPRRPVDAALELARDLEPARDLELALDLEREAFCLPLEPGSPPAVSQRRLPPPLRPADDGVRPRERDRERRRLWRPPPRVGVLDRLRDEELRWGRPE